MKDKLKTIQIIHLALCAGVSVAYVMVGGLFDLDNFTLPTINGDSMVYLVIPFAAFFMSSTVYKSVLKGINKDLTLEAKFPQYQTANIIRWAILEGAAFILLFLKPDFVIFGILIIAHLFFLRPTEDRMRSELAHTTI